VTEGGETASATGTINIEIDTTDPLVTTIAVSTSTLVTTSAGTEEVLTNFTVEITEDASTFPVAVTTETSFTISSPRIGGSVTVSTSLSLQSIGEEYPFVGELRIEGADGAVIVMIALDANTVRLEIDIDGDGATDDTIDLTWDELMAAAGCQRPLRTIKALDRGPFFCRPGSRFEKHSSRAQSCCRSAPRPADPVAVQEPLLQNPYPVSADTRAGQ